jgi:excinuclease ABC subunit C
MPTRALPRDPRLRRLREAIAPVLNRPGTYRMAAETGEVLYVGKSKSLRSRLLSYFRARRGEKGHRILSESESIEWAYEPSEFAALLRELELIKRLRPRLNVQQKRDELYTFVKLTTGPAPRLAIAGRVGDDPALYFGPFRGGRRVRRAIREMNDLVGLRDCAADTPIHFADQEEIFAAERAPRCHRYELQRCAAPCAALCTEAEYLERVGRARALLAGGDDPALTALVTRMQAAAAAMEFEHAARMRNRIQAVEGIREEIGRLRQAVEGLTFLYAVPGVGGDDRVYVVRRGTVRAVVPRPRTLRARAALERTAEALLATPEPDGGAVRKNQIDEILLLLRWFRSRPEEREWTAMEPGALPRRWRSRGVARPLPAAVAAGTLPAEPPSA